MAELIPHLSMLVYNQNGFKVPPGFAELFVKLHSHDWATAQAHWERIVELVLDTDAVHPNASGREALYQAVGAATILLDRTDLRQRCPLCGPEPTLKQNRG